MKPTTGVQDRELAKLLEENLQFTLSAREIGVDDNDMSFIVDWVASEMSPEDVFDDGVLRDWAFRHGFVEES